MAVLQIIRFGNPVLKLKSKRVEKFDKQLDVLTKNMADTMYDAPGVGLAGVQIGNLNRVLVYDVGDGLQVLVNAEIIEREGETEDEEGCLSLPEVRVPVKRYERVKIKGKNLTGDDVEIEADGLLARALQHEIDHTNGLLIIDRTSPEERKKAIKTYNEITGIV